MINFDSFINFELNFSKNDVLHTLKKERCLRLEVDLISNGFFDLDIAICEKIITVSRDFKSSQGINSLVISVGILNWQKKSESFSSPIILIPVQVSKQKLASHYQITCLWEDVCFNPILEEVMDLQKFQLPTNFDEVHHLFSQINVEIQSLHYEIEQVFFLTNAHPDRHHLLRELKQLNETELISNPLLSLLGETNLRLEETTNLMTDFAQILPADRSQKISLKAISHFNAVVIGPPGTGKSQVIINAIGANLLNEKGTLICSEKQAALTVVANRLTDLGLETFFNQISPEKSNTNFVFSLKSAWEKVQESVLDATKHLAFSQFLKNELQLTLDQLQHPTFAMGVDYETFILNTQNCSSKNYAVFAPDLKTWLFEKPIILKLSSFSFKRVFTLKSTILKSTIHKENTLNRIDRMLQTLKSIGGNLKMDELELAMRKSIFAQVFSSAIAKQEPNIFKKDSKDQKQLFKLRKKWELFKLADTKLPTQFGSDMSISELEWFILNAKNAKGFAKYAFWKGFKTFLRNALTKYDLIYFAETHLKAKKEKLEIWEKLIQLGISNEMELENVLFLVQKLSECGDFEAFKSMSEKEILAYSNLNLALGNLNDESHRLFDNLLAVDFHTFLSDIKIELEKLILSEINLENISENTFRLMRDSQSFEEMEQAVLSTNKYRFENRFPHLANWSNEILTEKLNQIKQEEEKDFKHNLAKIHQIRLKNWNEANELLSKSSSQLSVIDKLKKQRLKAGKKILVHEFGKKTRHLSILALYNSEVRSWIEILQPIIIGNITQVTKHLPFEANLFDFGLVDEASQILLGHSLVIAQRCKKLTFAGDPMQMPPTFFFKKSNEQVDALHQAKHYFSSSSLSYHYRSQHPMLLEFSNRFFYQNSLKLIQKGTNEIPIELIYCDEANYLSGINEKEIETIVPKLNLYVSKGSVGIVCFSETQQKALLKSLKVSDSSFFERESSNFCTTLDKVQGEECDYLIISLGYAPQINGKISHHFGPLNQSAGARRLNVLFSRAKKGILLVHSIKGSALELSTNEGVNMLRWYLERYENSSSSSNDFQKESQELDKWNVDDLLLRS